MGRPKKNNSLPLMVAVRMSQEDVDAIDAMALRLAKRTLRADPLPRAEIVRVAVGRGLKDMARELDEVEAGKPGRGHP